MNEKKKSVLDIAMKLFIQNGFAKTSIQDIIDNAKISKGTFYNYFNSKNECLIAILAYVDHTGDQIRRELAQGKDKRDEDVFVRQLAVRMNLNREHNLFSLFESVMFSDDPDLIAFIHQQHIQEIHWIAERIVDIYTPQTKRYALDQATMLLGITHHLMHIWKIGTKKDIPMEKLIQFALNRLKPVISDQVKTKEVLLPADWLDESLECKPLRDLKKQLIDQLEKIAAPKVGNVEHQAEVKEYLQFLIEEVSNEEPRCHILESIMFSLSKECKDSNMQLEATKLTQMMYEFINASKQS